MKPALHFPAITVACLVLVSVARAFTYDNGMPGFFSGRVNDSRFPSFVNYADNFSLPQDLNLVSITWYGAYVNGNGQPEGLDNFQISFFKSDGVKFSATPIFQSYLPSVNREIAANSLPTGPTRYQYATSLPSIDLMQGSYLVSIRNEARADNDMWLWLGRDFIQQGELSYYQSGPSDPWKEGQIELAFSITGTPLTPVPEPATYGLMGALALGGVAFVRSRQRIQKR